jgi:2-polyprenyl-6-methoxyphenol hydroxylase-like FAD-dependent oxidoreductase
LEDIHVEWNKRLVSIEEKDNQVSLYFEDGSHAVGDFLIGADGGWGVFF